MLYKDLVKQNEDLIGIVMEMSDDIKEMKQKVMAMTSDKPKKKGVQGLADILGCSTTTAQNWLNKGCIPHTRAGRIMLFDEVEVLQAFKDAKSKRPRGKA